MCQLQQRLCPRFLLAEQPLLQQGMSVKGPLGIQGQKWGLVEVEGEGGPPAPLLSQAHRPP